jgi:hypothetical protein
LISQLVERNTPWKNHGGEIVVALQQRIKKEKRERDMDSVKWNLLCIQFIVIRSNQYILIYSSKGK